MPLKAPQNFRVGGTRTIFEFDDVMRIRGWQTSGIIAIVIGLMSGCTGGRAVQGYSVSSVGYAPRGQQIIIDRRCGSCHTIPGIHDANGTFGPPLGSFARLTILAGNFPNSPGYLVPWIMSPTSIKPRTAMPDLGISQQQARDVAAYYGRLRIPEMASTTA